MSFFLILMKTVCNLSRSLLAVRKEGSLEECVWGSSDPLSDYFGVFANHSRFCNVKVTLSLAVV